MPRRRPRFAEAKARAARQPRGGICRALIVVDNVPLQKAAWRDLCKARKSLEKASRDLHRHEQVDQPGFRGWLGATFPELISSMRELAMQQEAKLRIVSAVEDEAFITGRSPRAVWREWQQIQKNRPGTGPSQGDDAHAHFDGNRGAARGGGAFGESPFDDDSFGDDASGDPWADSSGGAEDSAMFREFCEAMGLDPDDPAVQAMRGGPGFDFSCGKTGPVADDVREIYRRLVQQLHPDRGGEWTPQRARLWHQVQAAWAARDGDLLARLEAEWDVATDVLGPTSPVGRLRAAVDEIHAARRDAESRVRRYRKMPEWRFSLLPQDESLRERLLRSLESERDILRRDLDALEAVIAGWEKPVNKRARRGKQRELAPDVPQDLFAFDFGRG